MCSERRTKKKAREKLSGAFFALVCTLASACGTRIPDGKSVVDSIEISGVEDPDSLATRLATKETRTFLSMQAIYEYETFNELSLERDLSRIERELRRHGYYEAKVTAARIIRQEENHLRVEIHVDRGEPVVIRKLVTTGLAALPFAAAKAASQENKLRIGQRFDENEFEEAKQKVANTLSNYGYAHARVRGTARVDLAAKSAEVQMVAEPGARSRFGKISFEGLNVLNESSVRRVFGIQEGETYSRQDLTEARAALFQLGVFSRVELITDLSDPQQEVLPLRVRVEESAFKDITIGAGVRLDLLRLAAVGQTSWTHRNFFGGLRKFTVATRPGLTFYPTSIDNLESPTQVLPENFASVRLEQPAFLEARTKGFVEGGYNIYPLLYPLPEGSDPRSERIIGYNEVAGAIGAERSFFSGVLSASLAFHAQTNVPFYYQGSDQGIDGLDTVTVTYPELVTSLDFRDDPIQPTSGALLKNTLQVAIPFENDRDRKVRDIRLLPEVRTFVPLDNAHRVVFASRFKTGLVLNQNYGKTLDDALCTAAGDCDDLTAADTVSDQHKLLFRAFYSGGPGSNRGYPYRRIGPQGPISFLLPPGESCEDTGSGVPAACIRPLGGFTMWEASAELRFRAFENWSFVTFIDASDVAPGVASYSFIKPHVSIGPGLRYLSPVGPIRVDVGWRVPGLQRLRDGDPNDAPDVADVDPYVNESWASRFALHILIGEDF